MESINLENFTTTEEYNKEPVYYCSQCLSLKIKTLGNTDYCDDCGCTQTKTTDIFTWRSMYKERFGKDF